jgi:hypothetical protein
MKKLLILLVSLWAWLQVSAQTDFMLYDFDAIGQSLHVNPATPQQSKVWVALPALSGSSINYTNNAFSLYDVFAAGSDINENLESVARGLDDNSRINFSTELDILGVGFKTGKSYWSLGSTYNFGYNMTLPSELMKVLFANDANTTLTNFSLSDFGFEATSRLNFYLGFQRKFLDEKLTLGARVKYIFGQAQAATDRFNISVVNDSTYSATITADALARTSGANTLQDVEFDGFATAQSLLLTNNTGLGFDFGADYKLNDNWSFSASIVDLGSITWRDDITDYRSEGTFIFDGVDVDLSDENPGAGLGSLGDSLVDAFNFSESAGASYTNSLNTRYFASATYNLTKKHSFSAIYLAQALNQGLASSVGINYYGKIARGFQVKAGYSLINGTANNIGLGLQFKLGPVQLYLMSENALGIARYTELQVTNIRFGLNVAIFGKRKKQQQKEKQAQEAQ